MQLNVLFITELVAKSPVKICFLELESRLASPPIGIFDLESPLLYHYIIIIGVFSMPQYKNEYFTEIYTVPFTYGLKVLRSIFVAKCSCNILW